MVIVGKLHAQRDWLLFLAIAVLIVGVSAGYYLTLDMVFAPNMWKDVSGFFSGWVAGQNGAPVATPAWAPLALVLKGIGLLLPVWVVERILLFSILFFAGWGAYLLVPTGRQGRLFAGLLFMVNPFVYARLLAGHWVLLVGYAALPFAVKAFIGFFEDQSLKNAFKAAVFLTVVGFATHFLFPVFGVLGLLFILNLRKGWKPFLGLLGIWFVLNLYWIVPELSGKGIGGLIRQFGEEDIQLFSSTPSLDFNAMFMVASMQGFWRGEMLNVWEALPYWYLLFIAILYLAIRGAVFNWEDRYVKALAVVGVVALVLAVGVSNKYTAGIYSWLFENVFFFRGLREPQKLVGFLVLAYAYLGGLGFQSLLGEFRGKWRRIWLLLLLVPLVYTYPIFNDFHGQMHPMNYPKSYYQAESLLEPGDYNILFLPWHGYMTFNWSGRRIATPAYAFFSKPVIQGDTVESGGIYTHSTNPTSKYVEFLLKNRDNYTNFGELVSPINVKYVLLAKDVDWQLYSFLDNQTDLEKVLDSKELVVYRNRHPVYRLYQVDGISEVKGWGDLLSISKERDLLDSAYVLGNSTNLADSRGAPIDYVKKARLEYGTGKPSKKYLVFSSNFEQGWELEGQAPRKNMGLTNYYTAKSGSLGYSGPYASFFGYLISAFVFILLSALIFSAKITEK